MDLPKKERTFDFDKVGEATEIEYKGRFAVRCVLNIGQKHSLSLEKTRLMGDYTNPTNDLAGLAIVLSNLRARIIEAPEWWKQSQGGALLDDEDVLVALYNRVLEAEAEWKEELKKKTQKIEEKSTPLP